MDLSREHLLLCLDALGHSFCCRSLYFEAGANWQGWGGHEARRQCLERSKCRWLLEICQTWLLHVFLGAFYDYYGVFHWIQYSNPNWWDGTKGSMASATCLFFADCKQDFKAYRQHSNDARRQLVKVRPRWHLWHFIYKRIKIQPSSVKNRVLCQHYHFYPCFDHLFQI